MRIKGLLIDLDGVIYNDSRPIPGADATIAHLQNLSVPFCFITNTTMKSRATLTEKLHSMNIHVESERIFSAASAAADFLRQQPENRSFLLLTEDAQKEYHDIPRAETKADFVVVGDLGDGFSIGILNKAFNYLMNGARLIALQKNRFWLSDQGYRMDAGAFVALLEYAADTRAMLIGKPAGAFYETALNFLGCSAREAMMIGDDVESDIIGAKNLGMLTCLVETGKFRASDLQKSSVKPDWQIADITELPALLQKA